nr:hypothetical protein [uncultured Mediterranean phage uvMED]
MAKNVSNNQTLEEFRQSYNSLVDEIGGLGTLRTSQKGSMVDAVNSIIDQYFFFQDFEFDGSDGASSNRTFSGADNLGVTLKYSTNRVLVFKNGLLLRNGTDYSATNGTSITLVSSAANSDVIRITSFTGSYEGVAGATQQATTQWTKTGGGAIYNHDTSGGVVINADDVGVVTTPAAGYGIQLESDGDDIYLNVGGTSNEVYINGNLDLVSGSQIKINGSQITSADLSGFTSSVRTQLSASGDISYNSSTGVISFSQAGAPVTSVFGRTGAVTLTTSDVTGVINTSNLTENTNLFYTNERVDDRVNALLQAGTNMSLSYDDSAGTLTINSSGKTQEEIEDIVGTMFTSNTENGLSVTYDDSDGTLDVDVDDFSITLTGDVTGTGTVTNLGNVSFATTVAANSVALGTDTTGNYVGTLTAGTALTSTGATTGEGIAHSISLDNTAVTAGSYGSASAIPSFTVDAQGRLTAAQEITVDTYSGWSLQADTGGAGSVPEGTVVDIAGGEGIDTAFAGSTVTVSGENASTTNKGIASFNDVDFSVSSGVVSIVHEHIEDIVGGMLSGGGATSVAYNDATGSVTISSTDTNTNTQRSDEEIRDVIGAMISGSGATSVTYNDAANTLVISSTDTNTDTNTTNFNINANGAANENISAGETIRFNGGGATTVSRSGNTLTISSTDTNTDTNTVTTNIAGTGVSVSAGTGNSTISIGQAVATNSTVQFGEVRSTGDIIAYYSSDLALKENINPISNALDKVSQLGGYSFDWKDTHLEDRGGLDDMFVKKSDVGIIAQEVQKVLPEAVGKREDGTLGVRYELLVPLLVESIKELKEEIQSLKS